MNAVLIDGGEGFRALLTQNTLTIHDAHGGRVIVSGPDLEILASAMAGRGCNRGMAKSRAVPSESQEDS
jgi:hypothetical protein